MSEIAEALISCGLFAVAGIAGIVLRSRLPERHRDRDTLDLVRLAIGSLVTFLAIVMGLLTASSKQHFDQVFGSYRHLAATLVQVDQELRAVGADADPIRAEMRAYLAAVIFSTWPDEHAPTGDFPRDLEPGQRESTVLTVLLHHVESELRGLRPASQMQAQSIAATAQEFEAFTHARWTVIETGHPTIPVPFFALMRFWTALIFFGLGLSAPRNMVVAITILICAISLASVIYVILELDDPLGGLIAISSHPLRDALADIDRP